MKIIAWIKRMFDAIALPVIIGIIVLGFIAFVMIGSFLEPHWTADKLRDQLNNVGDVSEDYKQGWLDCVNYYLDMKTGPTNVTALISFVLKFG